ncbi:MAG: hypothetical protein J6252_00190, partial [Clostridia bacterium]|nr:hypothetical protein [Clostridia bacterium]
MKKAIAVLLCLTMAALSFAACGSNVSEESAQTSSAPASAAEQVSQNENASEEVSVDEIRQILDNPDIYKGD